MGGVPSTTTRRACTELTEAGVEEVEHDSVFAYLFFVEIERELCAQSLSRIGINDCCEETNDSL
jgi:hypothetical protein